MKNGTSPSAFPNDLLKLWRELPNKLKITPEQARASLGTLKRWGIQMDVKDEVVVKAFSIAEFAARDYACERWAWAVPDEKAIKTLVEHSPVVEIGAGTGYWARLATEAGGDVVAYDSRMGQRTAKKKRHRWVKECGAYFPVRRGDGAVPPASHAVSGLAAVQVADGFAVLGELCGTDGDFRGRVGRLHRRRRVLRGGGSGLADREGRGDPPMDRFARPHVCTHTEGDGMTKEQLLNELVDCEIERRLLATRAAALREQLGLTNAKPARKHISAAGRARIAEAQRKRWAANGKKAQQRATPQAAALKKRWAAFRSGKGPRPGATEAPKPAKKKVQWTPTMRKAAAERMRRVNKDMAKRRAVGKEAA